MNFIKSLHEGEMVSEVYFCKNKTVSKTRAGKTFYSLVLQDSTGTIDGKIWDLNNGIEHFEKMDFIYTEGEITSFNGALQYNIKRVRRAREGEYEPSNYMPTTKKNVEEMYAEVLRLTDSVQEPHLAKLLSAFFREDRDFIEKFKKHSAAKAVHHGFIGGLLQHTLGVAKLCDYLAAAYPVIDRDLVITAALCHDIGKLDELSSFPENDYTDVGNLVGHIVMGAMMVEEKIKAQPDFPEELGRELVHCILAHHGELEYGSPKKPALIEAVALNLADNADAKLETFTEILDQGDEKKDWLGFNRLMESNIRRTQP